MKIVPKCFHCIMDKGNEFYTEHGLPEEGRVGYILEILGEMSRLSPEYCAPIFYQRMLEGIEKRVGSDDLYIEQKERDNKLLLGMEDELRARYQSAADPLYDSLSLAVAGNYLDYTLLTDITHDSFFALMEKLGKDGVDKQKYDEFVSELARAHTLLFVTDNCGEIILDKLFMEELSRRFPALTINIMVRGGAAANDVTEKEAYELGLDKIGRVYSSGIRMPGMEPALMSEEAKAVFFSSDVIFAKGLGNFESLSGCGANIYYLFLCKCPAVAEQFSLPHMSRVFVKESEL